MHHCQAVGHRGRYEAGREGRRKDFACKLEEKFERKEEKQQMRNTSEEQKKESAKAREKDIARKKEGDTERNHRTEFLARCPYFELCVPWP